MCATSRAAKTSCSPPALLASKQEITYMSYGQGDRASSCSNIETGQREIVGNFPGMCRSRRGSPPTGQQQVIMTCSRARLEHLRDDLSPNATDALTDTAAISFLFARWHAHLF